MPEWVVVMLVGSIMEKVSRVLGRSSNGAPQTDTAGAEA